MKKESLISLSLAGAIGYYLYNKLQQFDGNTLTQEDSADERTLRELSWRPDPNVIEEPIVEEPVVEETVIEEPVLETPVFDEPTEDIQVIPEEPVVNVVEEVIEEQNDEDDMLNPLAAFPFSDMAEQPKTYTEPVAQVNETVNVDPTAWTCECCDAQNVSTAKFCNNCGAPKPVANVEEPIEMIEPDDQITIAGVDDDDMTNVDDLFGEIEKETPVVEAPVVETPIAQVTQETVVEAPKSVEPQYAEPIAPVLETPKFEPTPFVAPTLSDLKIDEPEFAFPELPKQETPKAEPVASVAPVAPADPVVPVESVNTPVEEKKVMENTEPLHKVDAKSKSAKDEYQSILDFINTL